MDIQMYEARGGGPNAVRAYILAPPGDLFHPSDIATLLSLYSRDPQHIGSAVKLAKAEKGGAFMDRFYFGYGHESVGENGVLFLALENVPIPVAKAVQQYFRYTGTEVSTRFLDCSSQPLFDLGSDDCNQYMRGLQAIYTKGYPEVYGPRLDYLKWKNRDGNMKATEEQLQRAAKAWAFDVMRGILPVGMMTSLSWVASISDLNKQVGWLSASMRWLPGVGGLVDVLTPLLRGYLGNIFEPSKYINETRPVASLSYDLRDDTDTTIAVHRRLFEDPYIEYGSYTLDYGAWRDIARHRSLRIPFVLPSTTSQVELHPFYAEQIPEAILEELDELGKPPHVYCYPLGQRIQFRAGGPKWAWEYVTKLRSGSTVHPTLVSEVRKVSRLAARQGIDLPISTREDLLKRGSQTIERK